MTAWDVWKKGFHAWESATAEYAEKVLRTPLWLEPVGRALTGFFHAKIGVDRALAGGWSGLGLPTRQDQERTLHALHQLESQLHDLREELEALRDVSKPPAYAAVHNETAPPPARPERAARPAAKPRKPRSAKKRPPKEKRR